MYKIEQPRGLILSLVMVRVLVRRRTTHTWELHSLDDSVSNGIIDEDIMSYVSFDSTTKLRQVLGTEWDLIVCSWSHNGHFADLDTYSPLSLCVPGIVIESPPLTVLTGVIGVGSAFQKVDTIALAREFAKQPVLQYTFACFRPGGQRDRDIITVCVNAKPVPMGASWSTMGQLPAHPIQQVYTRHYTSRYESNTYLEFAKSSVSECGIGFHDPTYAGCRYYIIVGQVRDEVYRAVDIVEERSMPVIQAACGLVDDETEMIIASFASY